MNNNLKKLILQGDSGGPLVVDNTLVGIISMGLTQEYCETLWFAQSFFTTIAQYHDWINETISEESKFFYYYYYLLFIMCDNAPIFMSRD